MAATEDWPRPEHGNGGREIIKSGSPVGYGCGPDASHLSDFVNPYQIVIDCQNWPPSVNNAHTVNNIHRLVKRAAECWRATGVKLPANGYALAVT